MKPADELRECRAYDDEGWMHAGLCKNTADLLDECERVLGVVQSVVKARGPISYKDRIALFAPLETALAKLRGQA